MLNPYIKTINNLISAMNAESFIPGIYPSNVISDIQAPRQSEVVLKHKKIDRAQPPTQPKTVAVIIDNPSEISYSSLQEFQLGRRIDLRG
jgi:hypothetical protein